MLAVAHYDLGISGSHCGADHAQLHRAEHKVTSVCSVYESTACAMRSAACRTGSSAALSVEQPQLGMIMQQVNVQMVLGWGAVQRWRPSMSHQ
jgi:hypothetical protein